jgi:regulator of sigma E protease
MSSVVLFIVVLGGLIFFHELGHFLVARLFDVGVEKFSLGFGPRIFGKTIGRTDYRLSLIPLGGYVKMIGDEPDSPIEPEDLPLSFTHKHVAKRSLIVSAGPLSNILLALLIYTAVFYVSGLPTFTPVVRGVKSNSPAAQAGIQPGDRLLRIGSTDIASWRDIQTVLDRSTGASLAVTYQRQEVHRTVRVTPEQITTKDLFGDTNTYYDLGISKQSSLAAIVGDVLDGQPAQLAGLKSGDRIVAIDDQRIEQFQILKEIVTKSQGKTLLFKIERDDQTFEVDITPTLVKDKNIVGVKQENYRIGVMFDRGDLPDNSQDLMQIDLNPIQALGEGIKQAWFITKLSGRFFAKLVQGKVGMESVGGPIRIAKMTNEQAKEGIVQLLAFVAAISIQLGILNLLPIPVLDGGHLLFYGIEAVIRRPVNTRMRETAQQIGIFLLLLMMIFVFYNDIRFIWFK